MKIKFQFGSGNGKVVEIMEFSDSFTEKQINEAFTDWLWDVSHAFWDYVKDGQDE